MNILEHERFRIANPFFIHLRKYSNSLRFWIFDFHVSSNHQNKKVFFLCFTLHVMNLEYMKV